MTHAADMQKPDAHTPVPHAPITPCTATLDLLLMGARSQNGWLDRPVTEVQLRAIHDYAKWGPTSMNSQPQRIVFVASADAKAKLLPTMAPGNVDKVKAAPVIAILAYDTRFYDLLPTLFPHNQAAKAYYEGPERAAHAEATALRNASLQAAYFMLAARATGLDCGPMSGFDTAKVDAAFFAGTTLRSNFLCAIGHGDPTKIRPRAPRLSFDETCRVV
jgi:3-hydroxypropanoate dehydrogenase